MKYLKHDRSMGWIAVVAALFLFSGNASAVPIGLTTVTIGGFSPGGTLELTFDGDPTLDIFDEDNILDIDELSSFGAVFTGTPPPNTWGVLDLFSFSYNVLTGIVETLLADNFFSVVFPGEEKLLEIDSLGLPFGGHYVDISGFDPFSFEPVLLAFSNEFPVPADPGPGPTPTPAPGTLLLLALGLLALGRRRA